MPSNYTGDPTATQAPSAVPQPELAPVASLPADGDPPNASTFAQALKVPMDFIAWLLKPRAKVGDYLVNLFRYRSALLHTRNLIDHLGFFGGRVITIDEPWVDTTMVPLSGASPTTLFGNRWQYIATQTTGSAALDVLPPNFDGNTKLQRCVRLAAGNTGGNYTSVSMNLPALFTDGNHIVWEWEGRVNDAGLANVDVVMGFQHLNNLPTARFLGPAGGGNWFCQIHDGVSLQAQDSGVAIGTGWVRFRIEWHGATVADNTTRMFRFYINGALVASLGTDMPYENTSIVPGFVIANTSGSAPGAKLYIGPCRWRSNVYAADVV